ncbi:MAG: LicD family protein [Lachnospiraceae bacterium]|nr:LicD family protein [Lachnospiraceae bacterium]
MDFSVDFFRDEVRNGFYIPTAIKQGWAASLVVLDEIDRICRKHDINYFADWGSFLGAVRHGGFVPWDDDLDICMKREDYDKFRAVADIELPKEFVIHDYERKEDHRLFLARVVSNSRICFDEEHLKKYHNFPYMASVDIFILDYLYNDEEKERERCKEIKRIIAVADGILEGTLHKDTIDRELYLLEQKYNIRIDRRLDSRHMMIELYKLAEKQMARAPKDGAERVGQIFPWILKGRSGHPRKYYDNSIRAPFENTTIPIPAEYNAALRNHYGNYLVCRKVWGGHDYPYFEKQRENLQAVADFKLPEFTFTKDMLVRPDAGLNFGDSLKGMAGECIKQLEVMNGQLKEFATILDEAGGQSDAKEFILALLPECQQLSVDLGTLIENVKGEDSESARLVTGEIQRYCDALFEVYNLLTNQSEADDSTQALTKNSKENFNNIKHEELVLEKIKEVETHFNSISEVVTARIINHEEILILTIGPKEWQGFERLYDELVKEDKADVYVVPLPVLFKDYFGQIVATDDELIANTHLEDYPENVKISLWTDFNLELHHPDRIYIQSPYDGENPCLTIPPQYYAKELRNYTDRLIYIPSFKTDEFGENDYTDLCNLKHYVTAPGVIYADEVLVQSENIKSQYVKKLKEFAGEETGDIWEAKIKVPFDEENNEAEIKNVGKIKKKLFYLIGLNELSEHQIINLNTDKQTSEKDSVEKTDSDKKDIIESIKNRLEIFKDNEGAIDLTVGFYPPDINTWNKVDSRLTKRLIDLLSSYGYEYIPIEPDYLKLEAIVAEHDAYYGSASPLVTIFTYNKKPVMISNYDI